MNPWQTLGVEHGANKREIKRAYSKLIKQHRPDDSPSEFQNIRAAYEQLLATLSDPAPAPGNTIASLGVPAIDLQTTEEAKPVDDHVPTPEKSPLIEKPSEPVLTTATPSENLSDQITVFIDQFEKLISRFPDNGKLTPQQLDFCRRDTVKLLRSDLLNHWHAREYIADSVFGSLCQNIAISSGLWSTTTNLPSQFLYCLDEYFLWTENEIELCETCDDDSAGLLFYCIHEAKNSSQPRWNDIPIDTIESVAPEQLPGATYKQKIKSWFSK